MKQLKNQRGSSYIFVMVISLTVFLMLSAAIGASRYEAAASSAYTTNASLYYLSESGVYKAADTLNKIILYLEASESPITGQKIMDYMGLYDTGEYYDFLEYKIETVNREEVSMVYNVSVTIAIDYDKVSFTILSEAENGAASLRTQGTAGLISGVPSYVQVTQIKQILGQTE